MASDEELRDRDRHVARIKTDDVEVELETGSATEAAMGVLGIYHELEKERDSE